MASAERKASLPLRRMQALPDFSASAAASDVTFGRLVDDRYDAQGDADPVNLQPVGPLYMPQCLADRVRQGGDLAHPRRHGGDTRCVQRQPVEHHVRNLSLGGG